MKLSALITPPLDYLIPINFPFDEIRFFTFDFYKILDELLSMIFSIGFHREDKFVLGIPK